MNVEMYRRLRSQQHARQLEGYRAAAIRARADFHEVVNALRMVALERDQLAQTARAALDTVGVMEQTNRELVKVADRAVDGLVRR